MSYEEFTKLCSVNDISEYEGKRFLINDFDVALFKVKGEVFALSNRCPHQSTAQIYDGFIEEECIVCPSHGWMFNLRTGKTMTGGTGLQSYETRIIDDDVYIKLKSKEWNW